MACNEPISFDQWITYHFDHPITDPAWYWGLDSDGVIGEVSDGNLVAYLTRTFEECDTVLRVFSDAQVDQGLQYLISAGLSDYPFVFWGGLGWRVSEAVPVIVLMDGNVVKVAPLGDRGISLGKVLQALTPFLRQFFSGHKRHLRVEMSLLSTDRADRKMWQKTDAHSAVIKIEDEYPVRPSVQ
jgi:hypothetical protein